MSKIIQQPNESPPPESLSSALEAEQAARWKLIDKADWKILVPIGVAAILSNYFLGESFSLLGHIGATCAAVGLVNGFSRVFRLPVVRHDSSGGKHLSALFWVMAILLCITAVLAVLVFV